MMFWALCVIGWIILWFKPDWRWLVALTVFVVLPGMIVTGAVALQVGVGASGVITNVASALPFPIAVFVAPAAGIVVLRQWLRSRAQDQPPPT